MPITGYGLPRRNERDKGTAYKTTALYAKGTPPQGRGAARSRLTRKGLRSINSIGVSKMQAKAKLRLVAPTQKPDNATQTGQHRVCTENLNPHILMMKAAKDHV